MHEEDQRFEAHKVVHILNSAFSKVSRKEVINQKKYQRSVSAHQSYLYQKEAEEKKLKQKKNI